MTVSSIRNYRSLSLRLQLLLVLFLCLVPTVAPAGTSLLSGVQCSTCNTLGPVAVALVRMTRSVAILRGQALSACRLLPVTETVCRGFIDNWAESVEYILLHTKLTPAQMCRIFLPSCPAEKGLKLDVTLDLPRPPPASRAKRRDAHYPPPSTPGLKVLHLADIHLDVLYKEGADNGCDDPLCCRAENGFPKERSRQAAHWGEYRCDAPPRLLHSLIEHVARKHKDELSYVLWTGDTAPHDSWKTTRKDVLDLTARVTSLLRHKLAGVPVYPVIGNHDSAPTNYFPPSEVRKGNFSVSWLYHDYAKMWKHWLPADALATLRKTGFYSVLVRPGFRIIVLNTNVAYRFNLWVLLTATSDPHHQLKWLAGELRAARAADERCHVVGHVSPADPDILPGWSHLYHSVIRSYQDVVTAQFFSHTHLNEIQLYKDDRDRPFSVSYVAPSLTPWQKVNPGYRIYTIDGARGNRSSWEVIDYERWVADLAEANERPEKGPRWHLQMSAAARYRLKNLSPRRWSRMVKKMLVYGRKFDKYYSDLSGAASVVGPCDIECRIRTVCGVVSSDGTNSHHCRLVRLLYQMGTRAGLS
ncbi:sphingomyelin phosphodiesterase-like isoform X1 [Amphibalanus amphitrite]|uniref:sphingomyelin phosphodiesterase-like isoform X1 n=1 Tax=Amphibalanus amphitrite TaxID=1232801 RepID=UPI001C915488|nr:sphingomyelin phosphodiesterase-like isoform X1 [Amphibalanus amphitrite]